ncbi:MAG: cyclic nucleotide-binding domain-containing protein [Dehalococcoidales bacterium]
MKMTTTTGKQALQRCQVFSTLDDVALDAVAASLIEKELDAGAIIFREGDPAVELLILQEGKVALQMAASPAEALPSRRITVDVIGANEIVGWSAVVEPFRYTLSGVCLQDTRALSISSNKLRWLMDDNRAIGFEILTGLSRVIATRLSDTRQVLVSERLPIAPPSPQ